LIPESNGRNWWFRPLILIEMLRYLGEGKENFKRPDAEYFERHGVALQTISIV
jgi:hypothetical protein